MGTVKAIVIILLVSLVGFANIIGQKGSAVAQNSTTTFHPQLMIQNGHSDGVNSLSYSPDGKFLASSSDDGTIKIWETKTWQLTRVIKMSRCCNGDVVFTSDGKSIATNGCETIQFFNIETGNLEKTFADHSSHIYSFALSPDGTSMASGDDQVIKLWELETGRQIKTFSGHTKEIGAISFSPDGRFLASSSWDKTVKLWDIISGKEIKTYKRREEAWNAVEFSKNGKYLAFANRQMVEIWEVETGNLVWILGRKNKDTTFWKGYPETFYDDVKSISFSPDNKIR
jgi:WD40 repeat protein